jgi:hypothetical protein
MNVIGLFDAMQSAVYTCGLYRESGDCSSPMRRVTTEAIGHKFLLDDREKNVLQGADMRWALANVLHFFSETEDASVLRKYNVHADKYLTGGRLDGAYGPLFLPQLRECAGRLRTSPATRRAVAYGASDGPENANRPACWSVLHFLEVESRLHMLVYQRSLNLSVVPYDVVLLTNVMQYMGATGSLHWHVGSLHATGGCVSRRYAQRLLLPRELLCDAEACRLGLEDPSSLPEPFCGMLAEEVRV